MRALLISIAVALLLTSASSIAGNNSLQFSIFNPGQKYTETFPFRGAGQTLVLPQPNGSVEICASGIAGCVKAQVPNKAKFAKAHVSGPFVSSSSPSWLAVSDDAIYLCSISARRVMAHCAQLGEYNGRDLDITVTRRGVIPVLTVASTTQSAEYIASYIVGFKSSLKEAAKLLRHRASSGVTTTPKEIPIVGGRSAPVYPDPGAGGVVTVQIGDIGGAPTVGRSALGTAGDTVTATACPLDQATDPETVIICGGGGAEPDPYVPEPPGYGDLPYDPGTGGDETGGPPITDCSSPSGAQHCPTKEELLARCYEATEVLYYQVYIPTCAETTEVGSPERAQCYARAADKYAADRQDCRDTYR